MRKIIAILCMFVWHFTIQYVCHKELEELKHTMLELLAKDIKRCKEIL